MELTKRVELGAGLALLALIAAGCLLVVAPFVCSIRTLIVTGLHEHQMECE